MVPGTSVTRALLLVFALSRALYYAAGVRFDARPLDRFFQFIDPQLLRHRLLESLYYFHIQPPGFNLFAGVVLKLFPVYYAAAFHAVYLLCGVVLMLSLYRLMTVCAVPKALATSLTALFIVTPGVILYENFLLYEYPLAALLALTAVLLHRLWERRQTRHALAFFACLLALVFLRNLFHLVYFLAIYAALWIAFRGRRKMIFLTGLVPLILILALYTKNQLVFGTFSSSTWLGMNAGTILTHQLTNDEKRHFVKQGWLSPIVFIDPGLPLSAYQGLVYSPAKTGIPVLDQATKSTGATNFNAAPFFQVQRMYLRDGREILRRYPQAYLRSFVIAWFAYFLPPGDFPFFDQNRPKIHALDRFCNIVLFGQWREAADRKELRTLQANGARWSLVLYTGTFLLIALPLLFAWGCAIWKNNPVLLGFLLFNIAYVTAATNLLSSFENNRYRFPLDAFYVVLLGTALTRALNHLLPKHAPLPSTPAKLPTTHDSDTEPRPQGAVPVTPIPPAVTVIIPAYRVTAFIAETLDSVFAQTFTSFEVILVNDGCPDTPALEQALQPYRDRIVYIKQENLGLSAARNTAIRAARAPLVALLDGDDLWEPSYLSEQTAVMHNNPSIDVLYCDAWFFGRRAEAGQRFMKLCPSTGNPTFTSLLQQQCNVLVTVLMRRDTVLRVGLFDEQLKSAEDFELWLRIAKRGGTIAYQRKPLVRIRKRPGSLSSNPVWMWGRGLSVLRKFENDLTLTPAEVAVLAREIRRFQANLDFFEGKKAFFDGDAVLAIDRLQRANQSLRRPKVSLLLFFLKLHPALALKLGRQWHRLLGRS